MTDRYLSPSECRGLGLRYTQPPEKEVGLQGRCCGLVAVKKAWELLGSSVPSRILFLGNRGGNHACLIFRGATGETYAFDEEGTTLLRRVTMDDDPLKVARAYVPSATRAQWTGGAVSRHNPRHAEQPRHEETGQWIETEKKVDSLTAMLKKILGLRTASIGRRNET